MRINGKLFCELNPTCYAISEKKEILKRHISNILDKEKYTRYLETENLPILVSNQTSHLIKRGPGIDLELQLNKANNIILSCKKLDGLIIKPGESFSFWKTVGKISESKGYKNGRVLVKNKLQPGLGGGLCNLANTIHLLIIHSPLEVTEFHSHSDALAPDGDKRIPFSAGTSVLYNYIDYRFKNNTEQAFQLRLWCGDDNLNGELRCENEIPNYYEISEENHHFEKEGDKYYRISKIYKNTFDKNTNELLDKKLILDNHSEVMYDYNLIPKELIKIV